MRLYISLSWFSCFTRRSATWCGVCQLRRSASPNTWNVSLAVPFYYRVDLSFLAFLSIVRFFCLAYNILGSESFLLQKICCFSVGFQLSLEYAKCIYISSQNQCHFLETQLSLVFHDWALVVVFSFAIVAKVASMHSTFIYSDFLLESYLHGKRVKLIFNERAHK